MFSLILQLFSFTNHISLNLTILDKDIRNTNHSLKILDKGINTTRLISTSPTNRANNIRLTNRVNSNTSLLNHDFSSTIDFDSNILRYFYLRI